MGRFSLNMESLSPLNPTAPNWFTQLTACTKFIGLVYFEVNAQIDGIAAIREYGNPYLVAWFDGETLDQNEQLFCANAERKAPTFEGGKVTRGNDTA